MKWFKNFTADTVLYRKTLYEYRQDGYDAWGIYDDKYKFEFYFVVERVWSLKGAFYSIHIPDCSICNSDLWFCVKEALVHMNDDGPRYYRLVETLEAEDKWKTLGMKPKSKRIKK